MRKRSHTNLSGLGLIGMLLSFLVASCLMLIPLGNPYEWIRPNFVLLVLLYWVLIESYPIGIIFAWLIGLFLDLVLGTYLGQYGFVFGSVVCIGLVLKKRVGTFYVWQQLPLILILTVAEKLFLLGTYWWIDKAFILSWFILLSIVVSLLCWPMLVGSFSYIKNRLNVT